MSRDPANPGSGRARVPLDIEHYALIGDTRTAALVGDDGSIDWLCLPRFDAGACFAALLGDQRHGRWRLAPAGAVKAVRRAYRPATLVLDTEFETETGTVRITDCMPLSEGRNNVIRVVHGLAGRVDMEMELVIRFDYGSLVPWVRRLDGGLLATAGPDALEVRAPVAMHGRNFTTVAGFPVEKGESIPFTLSHFPSHLPPPPPIDPLAAVEQTASWWRKWSGRCTYKGPWGAPVLRSLITLKALTFTPTGGIVAAPTTSLPEQLGGVRNWDYRFCWLRDSALTLDVLLATGFQDEAVAWREWLLRAAAGRPEDLQILYGVAGERRLDETQIAWLPGYQGAAPVRVGNAAAGQMQLDVYGEVMDMLHLARAKGLTIAPHAWQIQRKLIEHVESVWNEPDRGIWEIRGEPRHFTHSKVMAWVAVDRAVKAVERFGLDGPAGRWRQLRDAIHRQICERGYDGKRNAFVQYYGAKGLDASLLLIPLVGFLPPHDPRVRGTVEAIERELVDDGFVARYRSDGDVDGLPPGEGVFLPCSFWLVENLALQGRQGDARALFERLLALANDVGLISEEYDPRSKRLLGNFPQAFTHLAMIRSARTLSHRAAARARPDDRGRPL